MFKKRIPAVLLLLFASGVLCGAEMLTGESIMASEWRNAILKDVDVFPTSGTPGIIVVFGPNAGSILTSPTGDTAIAAAEYGLGRGVLFAEDSYVEMFAKADPPAKMAQIITNIKKWVCKCDSVSDTELFDLEDTEDFDDIPANIKILLWHDKNKRDYEFKMKLGKWIKAGGGIVYGLNPWNYIRSPGRTMKGMPSWFLLKLMGLCYVPKIFYFRALAIKENLAGYAHVRDIILNSRDDVCPIIKFRKTLEYAITYMSDCGLASIIADLTKMIKTHSRVYHSIPTASKPVSTYEGRALVSLMNRLYIREGHFDGNVPMGIDVFPGDFTQAPTLTAETVTVQATGKPTTFLPTGLYVQAGQKLHVTILSPINLRRWKIAIGAHDDILYEIDAGLERWPEIQITKPLTAVSEILCPFGGLVYIVCPNGRTENVTLILKNVVKAPYFDSQVPETMTNWETIRLAPGLWADICGKSMCITLPASSVRKLVSPIAVMELWDSAFQKIFDLRGMQKTKLHREWLVTDQQPVAGYMHAGYPIVTHLDVSIPSEDSDFLLNLDSIKQIGRWGVFHELGHNIQSSAWTFSGTSEVTNNVFTLYAMEFVTGIKVWETNWLASDRPAMETYLKGGADFNKWRSKPGVALAVYAQLARDFGWGVYEKIFREYDSLNRDGLPVFDNEKIDQWIVRFSRIAGKNLCPTFDFWGFPIRDDVLKHVQHLEPFLPTDETTVKMASERAAAIKLKYGIKDESLQ